MEEIIIKLKEAADLKATIAKQETQLWQRLSEAFSACLEYQTQSQAASRTVLQSEPVPAYMNTKEAAKYLGLSRQSLEIWRCNGKGPQYIRLGHLVRYRTQDLDNYATAHIYPHTASYKK